MRFPFPSVAAQQHVPHPKDAPPRCTGIVRLATTPSSTVYKWYTVSYPVLHARGQGLGGIVDPTGDMEAQWAHVPLLLKVLFSHSLHQLQVLLEGIFIAVAMCFVFKYIMEFISISLFKS